MHVHTRTYVFDRTCVEACMCMCAFVSVCVDMSMLVYIL